MSGAGGVFATIMTAVPITFGAISRMHERTRARWCLRNHDLFDADAREGDLVFVSGTVRALDETLVAPLSGRPCVAYRSRVRATWSSGAYETMQLRPFVIDRDDGGASIVVDGERAMFGVPALALAHNLEREVSFCARHAVSTVHARFSEVLLPLGAEVVVGGTLVYVPRDEPPTGERLFREPPPPEPQLVGNREAPLIIVSR